MLPSRNDLDALHEAVHLIRVRRGTQPGAIRNRSVSPRMPFPDIDPIAFSLGPLVIRWYALAYLAGFLGGWLVARRLAGAEGLWGTVPRPSKEQIDDFIVWIALGVILGGRLGYVLFYDLGSYLARPHEILFVWQGGMSFHGGLL